MALLTEETEITGKSVHTELTEGTEDAQRMTARALVCSHVAAGSPAVGRLRDRDETGIASAYCS